MLKYTLESRHDIQCSMYLSDLWVRTTLLHVYSSLASHVFLLIILNVLNEVDIIGASVEGRL